MMAPRPLLSVRNLTVTFTGEGGAPTRAVDGVGFTLYPDQTLAIVGESGSGKSVTALSLLRLIPTPPARIERGSARLAAREPGMPDRDLLSMSTAELRRVRGGEVAMIFQEPMTSLNPLMTVVEQIAEAIELHTPDRGREARRRAESALDEVGIPCSRARAYPHEFSGGMRQRVMIAMALACGPRVLLADEPTTALDVTTQAQVLDLIAMLRRKTGMGIVLITHDLGVVARRADVLCVMYAGRVVEYGPAASVLREPAHPYTRGLLACRPDPGARRTRLPTVREAIAAGAGESASDRGFEPWWPDFATAGGLRDRAPDTLLVKSGESHWVRAWNTPAAADRYPRDEPDVPAGR